METRLLTRPFVLLGVVGLVYFTAVGVAVHTLPLYTTGPIGSHTGNVLMTPRGPLWTDFGDVCAGPVEWDMASMTITDEALVAYPGPIDPARLSDCRDLRRLQILASLLVGGYDELALYERLVKHLDQRNHN